MKDKFAQFLQISSPETDEPINREEIQELALEDIIPNPFQPRRIFDPSQLEDLAQSINQYGVLQPIIVRPKDNHYELVSGERRYRASQLANKTAIPALVRDLSDKEVAEMALIENLQREDLNYFEEAEGYARLIQEFQITQEEVAKRMGKSQPTIANKLRLLNLAPEVRQEISIDVITERHARSLLKLKDPAKQLEVLHKIYKSNLNVRQTDEYIENLLIRDEKNKQEHDRRKITKAIKDMKIFVNSIKGTVKTIQDTGWPAEVIETDHEDYVEVTIRLPKSNAPKQDNAQ